MVPKYENPRFRALISCIFLLSSAAKIELRCLVIAIAIHDTSSKQVLFIWGTWRMLPPKYNRALQVGSGFCQARYE